MPEFYHGKPLQTPLQSTRQKGSLLIGCLYIFDFIGAERGT